ncbi:hypothetical protein [Pectobacterium punjabense]|uniref:hypothetical protein n=1 Tax=Pectobacterium punjabense TaxID=2108399 RepID=UPI0032F05588
MKINPIKTHSAQGKFPDDVFDDIEMFYNSKCWHGLSRQISLAEYEQPYYQ